MANELTEIRLSTDPPIPGKAMVAVVQRRYPRFDRTLLSKCENGDQYGIDLKRDALADVRREFVSEAVATAQDEEKEPRMKKYTQDGHRLQKRIYCRLEDSEYAELQRNIKSDGYVTMQDWITAVVKRYNQRKRKTRSKELKGAINMIINVQFKNKKNDSYGGRAYSYRCNIPATPGDIVKVPTSYGDSTARVLEIDVPECKIDERILPMLKTVTAFAEEEPDVE